LSAGGPFFFAFQQGRHITVFAPMGAGKGVGVVIPNLLDYRAQSSAPISRVRTALSRTPSREVRKVYTLDTPTRTNLTRSIRST